MQYTYRTRKAATEAKKHWKQSGVRTGKIKVNKRKNGNTYTLPIYLQSSLPH